MRNWGSGEEEREEGESACLEEDAGAGDGDGDVVRLMPAGGRRRRRRRLAFRPIRFQNRPSSALSLSLSPNKAVGIVSTA